MILLVTLSSLPIAYSQKTDGALCAPMSPETACAVLDRTQKCITQLKICKSDRRRLRAGNAFDMDAAKKDQYRRGRKHGVWLTVGGAAVVAAIVGGVLYAVGKKQ